MPIVILDEFKHTQFYSQAIGGWCGGLSEAALAFLAENMEMPFRPEEAMAHLREYVRMPSFGYNRITNRTAANGEVFGAMRTDVFRRQAKYEMGGSGTPGSWVTQFQGAGWAYLRLHVGENNVGVAPGSSWATGWFDGNPNHAGFVIWYSGEVCLFDPNVGGLRYAFAPCNTVEDFVQALDTGLDHMYVRYDRFHGTRLCRAISAKATPGAPA